MKRTFNFIAVCFLILFILIIFIINFYLVYPVKFSSLINKTALKYDLEPAIVASIIKAESGYNENGVSTSGARGLMQLKFSTAEEIANKLNFDNFKIDDLFIPEINIEFGCYYLRYLLNYYSNNLENTICAYNAGLSNVNYWLSCSDYSSNGNDLNSIPFSETSNYLNKVKANYKVYKYIYKLF